MQIQLDKLKDLLVSFGLPGSEIEIASIALLSYNFEKI